MPRGRPRVTVLTQRERGVMDLVCLGKTQVEIALILGKNVNTVKSCYERVREKLDAHDKALAVAKYLKPELFRK
jgi:DNA-binding CsgD family transcriptional regulator